MVDEEENPEGQQAENFDDPPPPIGQGETEMFTCPSCGMDVVADTMECPGCGVAFEQGEEAPPSDIGNEQLPSPYGTLQEQRAPQQEIEERQMAQPPPQATPPSYGQSNTEQHIAYALNEYSKKRRGRYLSGALSLGLGIILFVLLWVFVVNQVLITETENLFGFEIILLLVSAGVLFILGLYLILTYPKSSLVDVFASMTQTQQTN